MNERTILLRALRVTDKCFSDERITDKAEVQHFTMLKNERLRFQLAYEKMTADLDAETPAELRILSPLSDAVKLESVEYVPVYKPCYDDTDDDYLRKEPGFFPDLLMPVEGPWHRVFYSRLRTFLVTVAASDLVPGEYPLTFAFYYEGEEIGKTTVHISVLDATLDEQKLVYTNWFHADCIASHYGVEIYGKRHWELIEAYLREAVDEGVTMILTPVLTPPLDTGRGWQRPDVGLVDIFTTKKGYKFKYDKLDKWLEVCDRAGVKYFEISHLFCQWSAAKAPNVYGYVNGKKQKLFGWETDSLSAEYTAFLRAFVAALLKHLKQRGYDKRCFFHISDEPNMQVYDSYCAAKNSVIDLFEGYHVLDALSDYEFYRRGQIKMPVPATTDAEPFLAHKELPMRWTYYCCGQHRDVSNRFVAMPGQRTVVLGAQLYQYAIDGFLQWGYNFWYSASSWHTVNPFVDLSGDNWVPAGDTFVVYPGTDGKPLRSLHGVLFTEALELQRLLQTAERVTDRDTVLALVNEGRDTPITFRDYPRDAAYVAELRDKALKLIAER